MSRSSCVFTVFLFATLFLLSSLGPVSAFSNRHRGIVRRQTVLSASSSTGSGSTADSSSSASATPSSASGSTSGTSTGSASSSTATGTSNSTSSSGNLNDTDTKYVFAHFMVGNAYLYNQQDWADDMELAKSAGIDAFALNIGSDSWQPDRVADAYTAAESSNFSLLMSFDMSVLSCTAASDASTLIDLVNNYTSSSAQFKYQDQVLVTTFSGESCTFGAGSVVDGWKNEFTSKLSSILFVPSFMVDPSTFGTYSAAAHGQFNWNSGWPTTASASSGSASTSTPSSTSGTSKRASDNSSNVDNESGLTDSLAADLSYTNALSKIGDQIYLAAVSPWFFTHYAGSLDKNFVYLSDDLYPSRWQSIVGNRSMFSMVEIVTWNDYGESSYIGPLKGSQPEGTTWAWGYDHTAFLDMTQYYTSYFKTGSEPEIDQDKLYIWARPHQKDITATGDSVGKPNNSDIMQDAVFALVMAKDSASVTLKSTSSSTTMNVEKGVTQMSLALQAGDQISATLTRSGQTVVQVQPSNYTFEGSTELYNYNAFAAMAPSTDLYAGEGSSNSSSTTGGSSASASGSDTATDGGSSSTSDGSSSSTGANTNPSSTGTDTSTGSTSTGSSASARMRRRYRF